VCVCTVQVQEALRSNKYVALRVAKDRWVVQRRERGRVWRITLRDIVANDRDIRCCSIRGKLFNFIHVSSVSVSDKRTLRIEI